MNPTIFNPRSQLFNVYFPALGACVMLALSIGGVSAARAQTATPTPAATPPANPALYLPQGASVQVTSTSGGSGTSAAHNKGATAGITSDTSSPPAQPLSVMAPGVFSPTTLAAQPQPATITLNYNVACAGAQVLVAPLDGGTINGAPSQTITVGNDGTLVFSFQAPSGPGRYHVVTSLSGAEMAFPFDVPDPAAPAPIPMPSPTASPAPSSSPSPSGN